MSDLTPLEKRKFEQLLGMNSGYVLDFSNRSFAEFVLDSTGKDIYDSRYDQGGGSKANRLRAFWRKEQNLLVGKLMGDMLDYAEDSGSVAETCRLIVARLLNSDASPKADLSSHGKTPSSKLHQRSEALAKLRIQFSILALEKDRNKAGLALEPFINQLFHLFDLQPRQPFRLIGEQIDGSFELGNQIYLMELKWEKDAIPEADLLVFRGKIEGKSTFTRGVFIALNGISAPAEDAITRGKAPSFFVMTGYDLMMILSEAMGLTEFLQKRIRLLGEEGRICVPFLELMNH